MDSYTKISLAVSIEVVILSCINIILKSINKDFNSYYIIIAQCSLLLVQLIIIGIQSWEYKKEKKKFEERIRLLVR